MADLKKRAKPVSENKLDLGAGATITSPKDSQNTNESHDEHPVGAPKHGGLRQGLLMLAFVVYFNGACISLHIGQILGLPLKLVNEDYFYTVQTYIKQCFGLIINTITHWFSPTKIRISGDASVRGQLRLTKDGRLETDFPERLVLIANHQIYTDWLYMWWISYTSRLHGHIIIILKKSLKYIPVIGPGMILYNFIFLARNWAKDRPTFESGLKKLEVGHGGPMASKDAATASNKSKVLDPMWLLIFPEGTNMSKNARAASAKWAEKSGQKDLEHVLLPRSTGLYFCLSTLKNTVSWVYDCTIAYECIPRGEYGQDIYTLRDIYFKGRAAPSVNMHWRRFAVSEIPLDDSDKFELWLKTRWIEKDRLLERYMQTGRFPADDGHIETEVRNASPLEVLLIFIPGVVVLAVWLMVRSLFSRPDQSIACKLEL